MNVAKPFKHMTYEEFTKMEQQEGINYEYIDGMVMMSPRPTVAHQIIGGNLYAELRNILRGKGCIPLPETDLILEDNHFIPDLMVICDDVNIGELKNYKKVPRIVIEIVSPTSASRDCFVKQLKYETLGVEEYWVIFPEEQCIDMFYYEEHVHEHVGDGQVESFVLPDVVIDLEKIFDLSY